MSGQYTRKSLFGTLFSTTRTSNNTPVENNPLEATYWKKRVFDIPSKEKKKKALKKSPSMKVISQIDKDVTNTFEPYSDTFQFASDLAQPIRGVVNVIEGMASMAGGALALAAVLTVEGPYVLWKTASNAISNVTEEKKSQDIERNAATDSARSLKNNLTTTFNWLAHGATLIVRGITQIATTPLSWIKIMLRGGITFGKSILSNTQDDNRSTVRPNENRLTKDIESVPAPQEVKAAAVVEQQAPVPPIRDWREQRIPNFPNSQFGSYLLNTPPSPPQDPSLHASTQITPPLIIKPK